MNFTKLSLMLSICLIHSQTYTDELVRKKAIVIGASSGIGRAIAQELVKNNYIVVVTGRRMNLLEELQQASPDNIITQYMDVEQIEESRATLNDLITQLGSIDVFVYNSATWPKGPEDFTPENRISWPCLHRMVEVNVASFVGLTDIILDHFRKQNHGHIVGISSVDAIRGCAAIPIYCATKSFMSIYLEGLRNSFIQGSIPIDVTEIRPGWVQTSFAMGPEAYWVSTPEEIAPQIVESIHNKDKVAYVTRRWQIIGLLLAIMPDWLYNKLGGF